jgi:hypothetical protein
MKRDFVSLLVSTSDQELSTALPLKLYLLELLLSNQSALRAPESEKEKNDCR